MHMTGTRTRRVAFGTLAALGGLGALALGGPALAQANDRGAMLDEPAIVARPDIGGSGNFTGLIDTDKSRLCYLLDAAGVDHPTRAAIEDLKGKTLVALATPDARGASGDCVDISHAAAESLVTDAGEFALEIDNAKYPDGVVHTKLVGMP